MATERKPCPICSKVDCKRYGDVLISGRFNIKTGEHEDYRTEDYTITECELKKISEKLGKDIYIV